MSPETAPGTPMARALFRAVALPDQPAPYQTLQVKLYYPAAYGGTPAERNTGLLPAQPEGRPFPVVILMPGINVGHEGYGWLAAALAEAGFICLLYGWVVEEMPGLVSLSPGLDITALAPEVYGTRPSANVLKPILDALQGWNREGPLAGCLDLDRVLLGGHSAGGSVALMNARPDWFPGLRGVFAYGAHSKASTMLGYPPDTLLPLAGEVPTLIMGGSEDGVIAASAFRYGKDGTAAPDPVGPVLRTFEEGLPPGDGDHVLAIVEGANHFSLAFSGDQATGRPFLDWPSVRDPAEIRATLAGLVIDFARLHLRGEAGAVTALDARLADPTQVRLAGRR